MIWKSIKFFVLNQLPEPLVISVENAQDNYTYKWRDANGDLLTTNDTSILNVQKEGDYFVTAITNENCERTKKISIEASDIAHIERVDIEDVSENNTITIHVKGDGDYEFSLDDIYGSL